MYIIKVKPYRNTRLEDIPTMYDAAVFGMKELAKNVHYGRVYINIELVRLISTDEYTLSGECRELMRNKGRVFNVKISNDMPFIDTLQTIAHELTHVHQFLTHRLIITDEHRWYWKGKDYGLSPYTCQENGVILPWEVEASNKEVSLTRKFIKSIY